MCSSRLLHYSSQHPEQWVFISFEPVDRLFIQLSILWLVFTTVETFYNEIDATDILLFHNSRVPGSNREEIIFSEALIDTDDLNGSVFLPTYFSSKCWCLLPNFVSKCSSLYKFTHSFNFQTYSCKMTTHTATPWYSRTSSSLYSYELLFQKWIRYLDYFCLNPEFQSVHFWTPIIVLQLDSSEIRIIDPDYWNHKVQDPFMDPQSTILKLGIYILAPIIMFQWIRKLLDLYLNS